MGTILIKNVTIFSSKGSLTDMFGLKVSINDILKFICSSKVKFLLVASGLIFLIF